MLVGREHRARNSFCLGNNMRQLCCIVALLLVALRDVSWSQRTQTEERTERPVKSQDISAAMAKLEKTVNGNAIVRNRCQFQGKDVEIEETAEIVERNGCKLVVTARKVTRAAKKSLTDRPSGDGKEQSSGETQEIEFTIYADFSELTTPVLVETQKFAQCEAVGTGVLKVSSRSEPGKTLQVIRRSEASGTSKEHPEVKQTRRDLSLFFSAPAAAEKARKALERAVESCGGKEWPDEDDLP